MCRATAGAVGILLCVFAGLGPTSATAAETATQPFTTAGEHAFTVPAGVTSLQVRAVGGHGGTGNGGAAGGLGATATATLAVTPGETLYAEVAGDGEPVTETAFGVGGYGGGGGGVVFTLFSGVPTAGGGGGASDVRTCPAGEPACNPLASRLLVAGGGGGGAGGSSDGAVQVAGGPGGAAGIAGNNGTSDGLDSAGTGGGAATEGAAGAVGSGGANGSGGTLGTGGEGAEAVFIGGGGGGGGGGGIYGGGGGGGGAGNVEAKPARGSGGGGGGGGSSGVPAGATGVSGFSLLATEGGAEPQVPFTWTRPAPAVSTGAPSAITSTGATLAGTVNPNNSQITDCHFAVSNGASLPCIEQIGAGSTPVAASASLGALSPATAYTVTLVAASAQGSSSASPVTFSTQSPGAASGGALTVGGLRLSPTRFRRGRRAAALVARKLANATTISFTASAAATATLGFERARPGVLSGHRCVAASHGHATGRRCNRWARVAGGVTLGAHAGADRISFDGVLTGGARLTPGAYRVSLGAHAGTAAARAIQHPTFTLLP